MAQIENTKDMSLYLFPRVVIKSERKLSGAILFILPFKTGLGRRLLERFLD